MQKQLTYVVLVAGSLGSLVPGANFFLHGGPPLFRPIALLASGLGAMVLIVTYLSKRRLQRLSRTLGCALLALVTLTAYEIAHPYLTATSPTNGAESIQIGVHLQQWSLTDIGKTKLSNARRVATLDTFNQFALATGLFDDPSLATSLWKPWTVAVAGITLSMLYVGAFIAWTFAFGELARRLGRKTPS